MPIGRLLRRVGKGIGAVSSVLPGPAGIIGRGIGRLARGPARPTPVRSGPGAGMTSFAAPEQIQNQFRSGGRGGPSDLRRAAEGLLVGGGTAIAGLVGGPAGAAVFGTAYGAGRRLFAGGGPPAGAPAPGAPAIVEPQWALDLLPVSFRQEARAPKGFKVHTVTPSTAPLVGLNPGEKVAVRIGSKAASVLGVKRSKKPIISVRDSEAIRRANRAKKKLARVSKGAGLHVTMTKPRRRS